VLPVPRPILAISTGMESVDGTPMSGCLQQTPPSRSLGRRS
jgi:hypothetical protein